MITSTEITKVLEKQGYKVTKQAVKNWVNRSRIDAVKIDNSLLYELDDVLLFIQKRCKLSREQIESELKEIRTVIL